MKLRHSIKYLSLALLLLQSCNLQPGQKGLSQLNAQQAAEHQALLSSVEVIREELALLDTQGILLVGLKVKEDGRYCYALYEGNLRTVEQIKSAISVLESTETKLAAEMLKAEDWKNMMTKRKKQELTTDEQSYLERASITKCVRSLLNRQLNKYQLALVDKYQQPHPVLKAKEGKTKLALR